MGLDPRRLRDAFGTVCTKLAILIPLALLGPIAASLPSPSFGVSTHTIEDRALFGVLPTRCLPIAGRPAFGRHKALFWTATKRSDGRRVYDQHRSAQPTQMPPVQGGCKHVVISGAGNVPDPRQPHDPCHPSITRHTGPQRQKSRHTGYQHAFVLNIQSACSRIRIQSPSRQRIRIQVIELDRQPCLVGGTRIMSNLGGAHRASPIVQD